MAEFTQFFFGSRKTWEKNLFVMEEILNEVLVKSDLTSKLAITTLLVLICSSHNSLTNINVSEIVQELVEKGQRSGSKFVSMSSYSRDNRP
jgi:hypothetical protein